MRKKKKIIILISLFLFAFCYVFHTDSYAINKGIVLINSNKEVIEKGEEVEITVYIENAKTAAFHFFLYFDELKLEYISGPEYTNVIGNRVIFVWYDAKGGSGAKEGELVKFKFRAKDNGLATFSLQGEFYAQTGQLIQTEEKEKQIQIGKEKTSLELQAQEEQGTDTQNSNAVLQTLRLNKEGLTPNFEKDKYEYYLTIPNNIHELEVLAIAENPNATVEITGNTSLKEGLNLITIRVVSVDKTQNNVYTIQVTKTANLELANTNLEIFAIENVLLNPPFNLDEINYKAEVSNKTESIPILAIPQNEQATVEINGKDELKEGNNLISIVVTAPNGFTKKKYQVEIYKRNLEEEKRYQEQLEKQKENLEDAYRIEEVSMNEKQAQTGEVEKEKNQSFYWLVIVSIVIFLIGAGVIAYWKVKKRK